MSVTKTRLRTDSTKITTFGHAAILESETLKKNDVTKHDMLDFFKRELEKFNNYVNSNKEKLERLVKLFSASKSGNSLSSTHQIMFNQNGSSDDMSNIFLKQFVEEYGLDLTDIENGMLHLKDIIESFEMSEATQYCEVDLFNADKPPVEC
jgi:hypothetical protein